MILSLAACHARVNAQAQPPAAPTEVVVTGSRSEVRIDRAPVLTEVIRRNEIEQSGARDAAELLEERAGLQIVRSYRGSELQLRGLDPEYSLILVDSQRVPGQIDGGIDLSRYGTESIERIEIVRGPGSALYGADAIGGIINIITRESRRPFEASLLGSYGQRNLIDLSGNVAGKPHEKLQLQLTAELHRNDAYSKPGELDTLVSARDQWSTLLRIAYQADARNLLVLRGSYLHAGLTSVDAGGAAVFDRTQVQEQPHVDFEHRFRVSEKVRLSTRAAYSQFRDQLLIDQRGDTKLDDDQDNREQRGQLSSIASFELAEGHMTTVGAEEIFQHLESARLQSPGKRFGAGAFAQHSWQVYKHDETEFEAVFGVRYDRDSQFKDQLSPKLALRFKPIAYLEFRASYGHGFRAPTFQELLLDFENASVGYRVLGNPKLGAEVSDGFDVSARLFNEYLEFNLTFFRNDLHNMIAVVSIPNDARGLLFTYDNLENAYTMGIESSASVKIRDELSCLLSYAWLDTWDGENNRPLAGRPRHRFAGNVRYQHPVTELEFVVRAAVSLGRQYYMPESDTSSVERTVNTKPLAQADVRVAKHFGRLLELFIG
ncbi:MAG: hypothetical protein RL701_2921, partial [Pseudomonadota bacterium]